jgi:hypothetical protein
MSTMEASFYTSPEWRAARELALDRDGHRCTAVVSYDSVMDEFGDYREVEVRCDETQALHVHHLDRPEDGGDPLALDNLLTLCGSHHGELHALQRARTLDAALLDAVKLRKQKFLARSA